MLDCVGARESGVAECVAALPTDDPRYVVYDYEAVKDDGSKMIKTCFISYSPDDCTSM